MEPTGLPAPVTALLGRPELRQLADGVTLRTDPAQAEDFRVTAPGHVSLGPGGSEAFPLRHALELAMLLAVCPDRPALAGLAAARTACLFERLEQVCHISHILPDQSWIAALGATTPPDAAQAAAIWRQLAPYQPGADPALPAADHAALVALWDRLGPAEWLMEQGGDVRLRVDPATGLNGYGCSHRPRPWAITYASSTASSVSERGYAGAETARQRLLAGSLRGHAAAIAEAASIRQELALFYHLPPGAEVVLAASGTDCDLIATAIAQMAAPDQPLINILVAPEETGSGVPLAATGRHFAVDTAHGLGVPKAGLIEGYRDDIQMLPVPARGPDGSPRPQAAIAADCARAVAQASGPVLLHVLDYSKTGLSAPRAEAIPAILAARAEPVDVVVDACQARIAPERVGHYLRAGWMVLVTGSKFFTGPPFCGAILLPAPMAGRLRQHRLPVGLRAYTAASEWPDCAATAGFDAEPNIGLLLRWQAALAEMHAFAAVPPGDRRVILDTFTSRIHAAIAGNPDLEPVPVPALARTPDRAEWDEIGTILGFALRDPATGALLGMKAARQVYLWLNADLTPALPRLGPAEQAVARQRCHIGQPAPLPAPGGQVLGVLRLSAGARLVSGEPSHDMLNHPERLEREITDGVLVLQKTSLILRHLPALQAASVQPAYL